MKPTVNIFWFRRDLRLYDNAGLYHALKNGNPVLPLFIFDRNILDELEDKTDRRVEFIHLSLQHIQQQLIKMDSSLDTRYGTPTDIFKNLLNEYNVEKVFTNHDYEPYAKERDAAIEKLLNEQGTGFYSYKDQVILEKNEVLKDDGKPYTIFTPYSRKWKAVLTEFDLKSYPSRKYFNNFYKQPERKIITLEKMNFTTTGQSFPGKEWQGAIIRNYKEQRDIPSVEGTSRLSVHLRFGTISIRHLINKGWDMSEKWVNELIWREFYMSILWHFPYVIEKAFKPAYDFLPWKNNEVEFQKWCDGMTGYPIVDAGMRELNATGFMHNRLRMITAMFLTKYLLIDWRWGEAYFAKKLLDFELSSNNGGWQWSSGTGVDAAPYFRIFNMTEQTKRFDPKLEYIKKWVPEFQELNYPSPIIDYTFARKRCLDFFKKRLS